MELLQLPNPEQMVERYPYQISGGQRQRVMIAMAMTCMPDFLVLDEPTTGLHFADIKMLLSVLNNFVEAGNTVLVVEHNLDVIKTAAWVIDLGPEGGAAGGHIVATGTPEQIASHADSYTGRSLKHFFSQGNALTSATPAPKKVREPTREIVVRGAKQHNLKDVDVKIPRDAMTVCCGVSGSGKTSLAMDVGQQFH